MATYKNGSVPASARRTYLGVSLLTATANATERLVTAAKEDGVTISIFLPAGGYRSLATQTEMRVPTAAVRTKYNMTAAGQLMLAAPGQSAHGYGTAVDFKGGAAWLQKNAKKYGFSWPLGKADPNHWVHDGKTAGGTIEVAAPTNKRRVGAIPARYRTEPTTKAPENGTLKPTYVYGIKSYIHGEAVSGNDVWFQLSNGNWAWSGGFTDPKPTGIPLFLVPVDTSKLEAELVVAKARITELEAILAAVKKAVS